MPMSPDDLYWKIKLAAGAVIVGLQLAGIGDRVYGQLFPNDKSGFNFKTGEMKDIVFPAVLLTSEGETEEWGRSDSEGLAGTFPQRCWIADRVNPDNAAKEVVYLTARKTIITVFHQQKLDGCPQVRSVTVQYGVMVDPRLPSYEHLISGFLLKFEWGQPRNP